MYKLETHYLDIGQGDCSIIIVRETESHEIARVVVYDCGSSLGSFAAFKLLEKCTSLWIEEIHVAIISHFDEDHFNGFTSLFEQGANKKNLNYKQIRQLFKNTRVYSQGCIFQWFSDKKINSGGCFLSAYYFQTDDLSTSKTSVLKPYTNLLEAMSAFRSALETEDTFSHVSERYLAGFPTNYWSLDNYFPGEHPVVYWNPTDPMTDQVLDGRFTLVEFESGTTLLGEDLMNLGFDDNVHESITLRCIAVNKEVYDPVNGLSVTVKPEKDSSIANNMSLSCLLVQENYSAFFGGDLEWQIENQLIPVINHLTKNLGLTVLKAGHHGSNESTSSDFLAATTPKRVVITCGELNTYGHPGLELIERLYHSTVERVIIAGFGIREKNEDKYDKNRLMYQSFGVPVDWTDIYDPKAQIVLAGTFSKHDDGSIRVYCARDEENEIGAVISFSHGFTRIDLLDDNRTHQLSTSASVGIMLAKNTNDEFLYTIEQENGDYFLNGNGKRIRINTNGEDVEQPPFKKPRTDESLKLL